MSGEVKVVPRGRMFSVQYSLPHLPVPPLQQTMDKYLRSVRPLVTDEEFASTQEVRSVVFECAALCSLVCSMLCRVPHFVALGVS